MRYSLQIEVVANCCCLKCVTHHSADLEVRLRLLKLQLLSKTFKTNHQLSALVTIISLRIIHCEEEKPVGHPLVRRKDIFLKEALDGFVDELFEEEVRCNW